MLLADFDCIFYLRDVSSRSARCGTDSGGTSALLRYERPTHIAVRMATHVDASLFDFFDPMSVLIEDAVQPPGEDLIFDFIDQMLTSQQLPLPRGNAPPA